MVTYDAVKMAQVRKTNRLHPFIEKISGKKVKATCAPHSFQCVTSDNNTTTGKAGDWLVDEIDTWQAVPQAEFAKNYDNAE